MYKVNETTKWIHCNSCKHQTEHLLVARHERQERQELEEWGDIWWVNAWNTWECNGCKELVGEKTYIFSEDIGEDGNPVFMVDWFPERNVDTLEKKYFMNIPDKLKKMYSEVITCYNKSCFVLCAIGLRALLEGILFDKNIQGRDLFKKIEDANFIPEHIRKNLHGFRFLGNDAAHELNMVDKEDLLLAIGVIEDILNMIYELDYKSTMIFKIFSKGR